MVLKKKLLEEFQDGCLNAWPSLISEWNDLSNSDSPFYLSFCSRGYMVRKKILFEVLKTAAMVAQHNDSAGCESTIPSLMPYKLSHCTLQICRLFFFLLLNS